MPDIAEEDHATYANLLAEKSYFAGMRISTINAGIEINSGELTSAVIPFRRIEKEYPTIFNLADMTFDSLNQTDTETFEYQTDAGKFGEGFVSYFKADMSQDDAIAQAEELRTKRMFANEMLVTSVETFFYTQSLEVGLIFTYSLEKSNCGFFESTK